MNGLKVIPFKGITVDDNDIIYAWDNRKKTIVSVDVYSMGADSIGKYYYEYKSDSWDYGDVANINGKIVATPMDAKRIAVLDQKSNNITDIDIPIEIDINGKYKFLKVIEWRGSAILIGCFCPYIIKVDLNEYRIKEIVKFNAIPDGDGAYFRNAKVINGSMYVLSCSQNILYKVNPDDFSYEEKKIKVNYAKGFGDIIYSEGNMWLISRKAFVMTCWNEDTNKAISFMADYEDKKQIELGYMIKQGNEILIFPLLGQIVARFSINDYCWNYDSELTAMIKDTISEGDYSFTGFAVLNKKKKKVILSFDYLNVLLEYDIYNKQYRKMPISYSEKGYMRYVNNRINAGEIINEVECGLDMFVKFL